MVQLNYHELFIKKLNDLSQIQQSQEDFIREITFTIALDVSKKSYIPENQRLEFYEEIETEVIEIYRKKTYGFMTLTDYRRSLLNKLAG